MGWLENKICVFSTNQLGIPFNEIHGYAILPMENSRGDKNTSAFGLGIYGPIADTNLRDDNRCYQTYVDYKGIH